VGDVDFSAEGLLDGIDDERERRARLDLLERLHADGVGLEELRAAVDQERLVLVPVERALDVKPSRYTRAEVADRAGVEVAFLRDVWRALGMPEPTPDDVVFTDDDVEAARVFGQVRAAGLPDEGLLEIARVLGQSMARLASAVGGVFGDAFLQEGDTERETGERFGHATRTLAPAIVPIVTYVFEAHQLQALRRNMIGREEVAAGRLAGSRTIAVAFADLVGFTRLGEDVPASELGAVAGRLERLAAEVAGQPVTLVKMIGDAAMLVSWETDALVDASLTLIEAADAEGDGFPQLRVGLATGEAIGRAGDWFGQPVNLASRICSSARPGSLLTTNEVRDEVGDDGFRWSRAGKRRFKGVRDEVGLHRVRRDDGEQEDQDSP
jgi:adenylate cyclase